MMVSLPLQLWESYIIHIDELGKKYVTSVR